MEKELEVICSDQVKEAMESDPKLADAMRDMMACMRQAHHDVKTGKYDSFDDAMEAITGERPEFIPFDDDEPHPTGEQA